MKLAEILTGPERWWRGMSHGMPRNGETCLMIGASVLEPRGGHERMMRILGVQSVAQAAAWNDNPQRTWEEIAAVVDAYDRDRLLNP